MAALVELVVHALSRHGVPAGSIYEGAAVSLPGYYRPEKRWDVVVVHRGRLLAAVEFKAHVGPSFGNNYNNRAEEAIGSGHDIWKAWEAGLLGEQAPPPFVGYCLLVEDCAETNRSVRTANSHFSADEVFAESGYLRRYEILCRRLVRERCYSAACLLLAVRPPKARVRSAAPDVDFNLFVKVLCAHTAALL